LGNILGRYILREVVAAWLLVTGVVLIILLANQVAAVLQRAAVNQYPQGVVLELIFLGALQNLAVVMPFGLLLGVVLAFGRLYHDSEMAAVLACGASPLNVYLPVGLLALLVTGILAALTLKLAPDATVRTLNLRSEALRAGQFAPISPGKFRLFGGGSAVVYAEDSSPDGTILTRVFVERSRGPVVEVAVADHATHKTSADGMTHIITLYDGERYEGVPGSAEFKVLHFDEPGPGRERGVFIVPIQVPPFAEAVRNMDAQPSQELLRSKDPVMRAELHWRLAMPLMCIVLALLAIPLSRLRPRQGRYDRVWLGVLIYFLYFNLISTGKSWIARGKTPEPLGLWWVHVLVVLLALAVVAGPGIVGRLRYQRTPAP
jgi:lipopolysaccharide export system permease protein